MQPEPSEFNSAELVKQAIATVQNGMIAVASGHSLAYVNTHLEDALRTLLQADAQNEHCGGRAYIPTVKDPWDWEDADSFGPSA